MQECGKNILIVGAGIHGTTIALELAKKNNVVLIDSSDDILTGTSKNNHNRIHLGYHYPRSKDTIQECKLGYNFFIKNYKDCLEFPDFYYVISKKSKINSSKYKMLMKEQNLECITDWPGDKFLNRNKIEDSFKVKEACINITKLRKKIKNYLKKLNVKMYFNFALTKARKQNKNSVNLYSSKKKLSVNADIIINCTYSNTNNILKCFKIKDTPTKYVFEEAEVAVVKSSNIIPALTVMDGPYISILPYAGHKNLYLVYDVVNSVINKNVGTYYNKKTYKKSNWKKMLAHGLKYYPFFNDLEYKYSLYSNRPIPVNIRNDSRVTRIVKQNYEIDFYSVKEGKLISAPYVAQQFKNMLLK